MATNGILKFQGTNKATFVGATSNVVIDTVKSSFGIGVDVDGPTSNLHVVGNAYVSTELTVGGTVTATTFSGSGSGLTALNATNITTGTLDAARIPTLDQNTTGSAGSAATLTTPRSIDGVNFDGSADIVLPVPTTFGAATFSGDVAFDTDTLKIDSTNNRVGIGTASPSANLHVVGNVYVSDSLDGNMMIEGTGLNYSSYLDLKNTSRSEVVTETGGWYRIRSYGTSARNGDLAIEQMSIDGTSVQGERLTINNIGNVGIGTTSPSHLLNVKATSGDAEVHIQAQGNDGGDAILYFNGASTNQRKCAIISSNVAPNSYCKQDLHFCMETTGDLSDVDITDSKMVLTNAGNVGIGTSSFVDTRNVGGLHIQNSRGISFQVDTTQTDSRNWRLRSDDYGDWGSLQFSVSDDNSTGPDAADEVVMTMTKERNVGIGTTSPNASLHIDGSLINTAKIQLLQKLVTITGGNNQLHAIQQGMQLYAGDGRSDWQNYQFASDSQWLIGLLGTDMVNGGSASNADMTISCKCDVTAFLISNTSGWNGVTMTGWNSLGTVASIMDGYTSTFEIWAKTLSAGTHSFDTYSAMYAFTI